MTDHEIECKVEWDIENKLADAICKTGAACNQSGATLIGIYHMLHYQKREMSPYMIWNWVENARAELNKLIIAQDAVEAALKSSM